MPAWSSCTADSERKSLDLCLLNARSVRNKTLAISDFITDLNIDIMALTETCPPPSQVNGLTVSLFFAEFS